MGERHGISFGTLRSCVWHRVGWRRQCAIRERDLVKRGDYLVNGILTCGNCHTPKGPQGDIMDKAFSGGLSWDEPPFKVTAPNITQDKETGIGSYTDAELKTGHAQGHQARTACRSR